MFKKILYFIIVTVHLFALSKETAMNDHEPIHIFAALKFPLNSVQDSFTLNIFKTIDATFGSKGIGLDAYQIEHIKKTYLYLIFLTKLEKVLTNPKYKEYQKDFKPFLKDNGTQTPHMITTELLQSNGWNQLIIDQKDVTNSTIWQYFCKSMVTDIYAYLKLGLNMIHNTEKQEFNYIPHFETSYYDEDFEQLRNINAIVRIKLELEQQIQSHYLAMCNDWKNLPIIATALPKNQTKSNVTVYNATQQFSLTEFYKKTHDLHHMMGTRQKVRNSESLNPQDFMSAPQMISPLKDYVFCYFLLYELYGQLTSFMTIDNLDTVISICSSSNLQPNIFPYTDNDYVLISELLATKSAAQKNHTNSLNPPINTYKKEDLRKHVDMLNNNPRKSTEKLFQEKISQYNTAQASVQAQSFFSFFSNLGSDIVHAAKSAWSDIKSGAEDAWAAVKHAGEAVGYGVAGLALDVAGQEQKGSVFFKEAQADLKKSVNDLSNSMKEFNEAFKDGIVAPVAEISSDLVGFVLDDQKIGQDLNQVIDNCANVLVDVVSDAFKTALTATVYVASLPLQVQLDLIQLTIAAVYATVGGITGNQQELNDSLDICHCVLRSLVTVYLMTAKAVKDDFATIMQALNIVMNGITTLFNDLIVEVTAIALTGGASLVFDIVMASTGESKYNYLDKAANIVRNTLNQHREIENQVLGVAVCIAVDVATGGEGAELDAGILDSATEDTLNSSVSDAESSVQKAQDELENAQQKAEEAQKEAQQNPNDQDAQEKAKEAKEKVKEQEKELKQQKNNLKNAKDTKSKAIQDAKDLKYGKNLKEKLIKKAQNFFSKCKDVITKSATKTQDLFNSLATSIKNLSSASPAIASEAADSTSAALESIAQEATATSEDITPLAQNAKEALPPEVSEKLISDTNNLSDKISNLNKARDDFQAANAELKAAQNDSQQFAAAQKKLLDASKVVQKASADVEKAQGLVQNSFNDSLRYEKDFNQNPVNYITKNANESLKIAEDNLATEKEIGDAESIQNAENEVKNAKILSESLTKVSQQTAKLAQENEITVSEKFANKFQDMKEYFKSKARSFTDLFSKDETLEKKAADQLAEKQKDLKTLQSQLAKDQENLEQATTDLKKNPEDADAKAEQQRAEDQVQKTKLNIKAQQREVDRAQEYANEREAATKKSTWDKTKEIGGKILGNAGTIMNIMFNFTPIISSYNQDQKNILQQKQQAEQVQDLWKANNETKISTIYNDLEYLTEFYEKEKTSIGNQVLGMSLFQNYNYSSIASLEQSILASLAMIYTIELYPQTTNNLVSGNTGTLWSLICPYLNLYPSQGFYTTTIGRTDFPFAQEIAQAPELLTTTSKTKVKEWFNQRCTAIDQKNENNTLKKPTDPLEVSINFKFLYTLDSEFYVGIYMGKNFYDYFNASYIASLLGTTTTKLAAAYGAFRNNPTSYPFNLNYINLNETYMAKIVVLYRKSATENLKLGVYEHNLTNQEWLFTQELPATMQLNHEHEYHLSANLNGNTLQITLTADNQTQTKISQIVQVTPLDNQRQYGIISSSAAIEWNQLAPKISIQTAAARKSNKILTPEIERNKQNKLLIQDAINQEFGGKKLTIISKQNALIFSQYIYASVQTDIAKITPKNPSDLLVFATNTNGTISNLGKAPNSFTDSTTNVLVSLVTGHVFDNKWNCIQTIQQPWKQYSTSEYGPFLPSINQVITKQQNAIAQKLSKITFGSFDLDIVDNTHLINGVYIYTCTQTLLGNTGKPLTDYLVFASQIPTDLSQLMVGLPPTANNVACMISLVSGNVYTKETAIPKIGVPVSSQPALNIITTTQLINYVFSLDSSLTNTIQTQQQAYNPANQISKQTKSNTNSAITIAKKQSLTKDGDTPRFKFHFNTRNFSNRQKQAAGGFKFHFVLRPKNK